MSPDTTIHPILPKDLANLKNIRAEQPLSPTPHTLYLSGGRETSKEPQVRVNALEGAPGEANWSVEVTADGLLPHLYGRTVGTLRLPDIAEHASSLVRGGLADMRPKQHAMAYRPATIDAVLPRGPRRQFGGVFPPDDRKVLKMCIRDSK